MSSVPRRLGQQSIASIEKARAEADRAARFRAGDTAAFEELLAQFWDRIVAYVERLLGDRDVARDIAQDAFVRLWTKRHQWIESASIPAFLYHTARNLTIDEHRRDQVRKHGVVMRYGGEIESPPTPARDLETEELRRILETAVNALSPQRREVFCLYYEHNMSYRQIAATMGIKPQVVANYMSAALAALRETLKPMLPRDDTDR